MSFISPLLFFKTSSVRTDKYLLGRNTLASLSESSFNVMRIAWLNLLLVRTALIIEYGVFIRNAAIIIECLHTAVWNRCTRSICQRRYLYTKISSTFTQNFIMVQQFLHVNTFHHHSETLML
jgi:hypothetical protein